MRWLKAFVTASFDRLDQWRINQWWKLRREGKSNEVALKKSYLSAKKALAILEVTLSYYLGTVGVLSFSNGKFASSMNDQQLSLVLEMIVELTPVLPEAEQTRVREQIKELSQHNWGYVRRATDVAMQKLCA